MDVFAIATSGMQAAVAKLDVAASNIANSGDDAPMSATQPAASAAKPFQPQQASLFSLADGGVGVQTAPAPGDDMGLDLVTQMMAIDQFKASANVFQTGEDAMKALLSIKA